MPDAKTNRRCPLRIAPWLVVAALGVSATAGAGPGTAAPGKRARAPQSRSVRLSDERRLSRWAHPARVADVFSRHTSAARRVGQLRLLTEDGLPEVYLLLRQYTAPGGRVWVKIRLPRRPNGRTGWVARDALASFHVNRFQLVIRRRTLRATLLRRGRRVWSARVGIGAPGTVTPGGRFYIREKLRFRSAPVYGTRALGTSAYSPGLSDWPNGGVIGIHGTDRPDLIPGRPSHGCIRIRNGAIARLWRMVPVGTPLWIR